MLKAQPTAIQNITLNLIFAAMGECRFNRKHDEYMAISNRLPRLKQLTFQVNRLLQQLHRCNEECKGFVLPQIEHSPCFLSFHGKAYHSLPSCTAT